MIRILFLILTILLLNGCNNIQKKAVDKNEKSKKLNCVFSNPDTSVAGIKIRDAESVISLLGRQTQLEGDSTHVFYSIDKKQLLKLRVHPGDILSQVSIFTISYSKNLEQKNQKLNIKIFQTEKGVKLGMNKNQIIEKLGTCYKTKDSTNAYIELYYCLELPYDSKGKLLERNNMPGYYASYKLKNDRLENFEFGFEYP